MTDPSKIPDERASSVLLIRLAAEHYALPSSVVREISRWHAPTPVPGAPEVISGIVSQRGVVLPVVDLRLLVGMAASPPDRSTRLVVVQYEAIELALLVDEVLDLVALAADMLEPVPAALDAARARLLRAIARYKDLPLAFLEPAALIAALTER